MYKIFLLIFLIICSNMCFASSFEDIYGKNVVKKGDDNCLDNISEYGDDSDDCVFEAEECYRAELFDQGINSFNPKIKITYRLCALFGGNRTITVSAYGGCGWMHLRRFCARPGVKGEKSYFETKKVLDGDPTKQRICVYEDWLDIYDNDSDYQPEHLLAPRNKDSDESQHTIGFGDVYNQSVVKNLDVCTRMPVGPYPPAFYFHIPAAEIPPTYRRVCNNEITIDQTTGLALENPENGKIIMTQEKINSANPCVKLDKLSNYKESRYEIGFMNYIPKCEVSDDKICAEIRGSISDILDKNHILKRCESSSSPCFNIKNGSSKIQDNVRQLRILYSYEGQSDVITWNDDEELKNDASKHLEIAGAEIYKADVKDGDLEYMFETVSYSYDDDPFKREGKSSSVDMKSYIFHPTLGEMHKNGKTKKYKIKDTSKNDNKKVSLSLMQDDDPIENVQRAVIPKPEVIPCQDQEEHDEAQSSFGEVRQICEVVSTHFRPRLKARIGDVLFEIGTKENGKAEDQFVYGYKFSNFVTDDQYIIPFNGYYIKSSGNIDDSISGEYYDNNKDGDYKSDFESKKDGVYVRGGTKICLTGYEGPEQFVAKQINLKGNDKEVGAISPFREHLVYPPKYDKSLLFSNIIGDYSVLPQPNIYFDDDDSSKGLRLKTPAEQGHCVRVPEPKNGCGEVSLTNDSSIRRAENGFADWPKAESIGDVVKGQCIFGYEENGGSPKRRCIIGEGQVEFGIVERPCVAKQQVNNE